MANVTTNMGPPMELGPAKADPGISSAAASYTGSGYGPVGQGTVGVGTLPAVTQPGVPAQVRFFNGADGNLYALDNVSNVTFKVGTPATPGMVPPVYSPTAVQSEPRPTAPGQYYGQKSPQGEWWWDGTGLPGDEWIQASVNLT